MKYIFFFIGSWIVLIGLIFIILNNSIDYNPISSKIDSKKIIFRVLPQGWAFFTKNPRDAENVLYKLDGNKILEIPKFKNSSPYNFFGLQRNSAKIQTELLLTLNKINISNFKKVEWNFKDFKYGNKLNLDSLVTIKVENMLLGSSLTGRYLLIKQEPIPWAWSKHSEDITISAKAIIFNYYDAKN